MPPLVASSASTAAITSSGTLSRSAISEAALERRLNKDGLRYKMNRTQKEADEVGRLVSFFNLMASSLEEAHRLASTLAADPRHHAAVLVSEPWDRYDHDAFGVHICDELGATDRIGYLEGWYVAEHARQQGTGRELVAAAERWARSRGCTEMASDTELANRVSETAHLRLGYQVAARVTAFRKRLK